MPRINVNDQNFDQEVLGERGRPVLVDFWATWCHPCRIQGPIVEQLANELGEKAKVVEVEVDESPNISQKYNILSIPTLAIIKDGEIVWQGVGVHQKNVLAEELKKHF